MSKLAETTQEEFNLQIINALKTSKLQETLRSTMRVKLIEKMRSQDKNFRQMNSYGGQSKLPELTFPNRLLLSLVGNYLRSLNLDMTLAVLEPEITEKFESSDPQRKNSSVQTVLLSDIQTAQFLGQTKIQQFYSPNNNQSPYEALLENLQNDKTTLLEALTQKCFTESSRMVEAQTQTFRNYGDVQLDEKLQMLDKLHLDQRKQIQKDTSTKSSIGTESYLKQLDLEKQKEIKRFKEIELKNMRAEEAWKFTQQFEKYQEQVDQKYFQQLQNLKQKETKLLEQFSLKVQQLEEEQHNKASSIQLSDQEFQLKFKVQQKEITIKQEQLEKREDDLIKQYKQLQRREKEINMREDTLEQKVALEMDHFKSVTMKDLIDQKQNVQRKIQMLDSEMQNISNVKQQLADLQSQYQTNQKEMISLRTDNQSQRQEKQKLEKEIESLRENMRFAGQSQDRTEVQFKRIELEADNLRDKNENMRNMNQQYKELLELRRVQFESLLVKRDQEINDLKKLIDRLQRENDDRDKKMVEGEIRQIESKYKIFLGGEESFNILKKYDEKQIEMAKRKEELKEFMNQDVSSQQGYLDKQKEDELALQMKLDLERDQDNQKLLDQQNQAKRDLQNKKKLEEQMLRDQNKQKENQRDQERQRQIQREQESEREKKREADKQLELERQKVSELDALPKVPSRRGSVSRRSSNKVAEPVKSPVKQNQISDPFDLDKYDIPDLSEKKTSKVEVKKQSKFESDGFSDFDDGDGLDSFSKPGASNTGIGLEVKKPSNDKTEKKGLLDEIDNDYPVDEFEDDEFDDLDDF